GYSDGHVHASLGLAGSAHVDPHRSKLGLRPVSSLLGSFECGLLLLLVRDRFYLQALSDSLQIRNAGALHGEWLLAGLSGPVVADHAVRALPQRFIREIALPLNDRSPLFHLARGREQGLVNLFRRRLRERDGRKRQYAENDRYHTFHSVPPI